MSTLRKITAQRSQIARKEAGLTGKEASTIMGILSASGKHAAISNYECGIRPIPDEIKVMMTQAYNVNIEWLFGLTEDKDISRTATNYVSTNKTTLVYNDEIINLDDVPNNCVYTQEYIDKNDLRDHKLTSIIATDSSMKETINEGDELLIDLNQTDVKKRDIFAILVNDNIWIRWIQVDIDGGLVISSEDNESYPARKIDKADTDSIKIIGRIIRISKNR